MPTTKYRRRRRRKRLTKKQMMYRRRQIALISGLVLLLLLLIWATIRVFQKDPKEIPAADSSSLAEVEPLSSTTALSELSTTAPGGTTTTLTMTTADPNAIAVKEIQLTFYEVTLTVGASKMPIVTMKPDNATDKGEIWESSDTGIATVNTLGKITAVAAGTCDVTVFTTDKAVKATVHVTVSGSTTTASGSADATQPTYIKGILVVNKTYALPQSYAPGLDAATKSAFDRMQAAATKEGLNIYISSSYRSYDYQKRIYNNYCNAYGAAQADTFSARPGHSEHQTGLAIDMNSIDDSFADTPEAAWVAAHAHEYGFILRYPKGKESITGYKYESWHVRYLGVETATAVYNSGKTLEEYLGITSCYS